MSADKTKGYAVRVGSEIWVRPGVSEDIDAALEMMTLYERERTARQLTRMLRWAVWRMKHRRLAAWLDAIAHCGL